MDVQMENNPPLHDTSSYDNDEEVEMQSFVTNKTTAPALHLNKNNNTNAGPQKRVRWDEEVRGRTPFYEERPPVAVDLTDLLRRHYNYRPPPVLIPPSSHHPSSRYPYCNSFWRRHRQKVILTLGVAVILIVAMSILGQRRRNSSSVPDRYTGEDDIILAGETTNEDNDMQQSPLPPPIITSAVWKQQEEGTVNGDFMCSSSGRSVALSADGTIMAVGAPYSNVEGIESGEVKVYIRRNKRSKSSEGRVIGWEQLGQSISAEGEYNHLGWSVALSSDGKVLVVGAPSFWDASRLGYAKVFALTDEEDGEWIQRGDTIYSDEPNDSTGLSVSISSDGDVLAIGSPWNNYMGKDSGMARVYKWDESNYNPLSLSPRFESRSGAGNEFGSAVSLSAEGVFLAIGSPGIKADKPGYVDVYAWDIASMKYHRRGSSIHGKGDHESLGFALALSKDGNRLAIGAPGNELTPGYVALYQWDDAISNYKQLGTNIVSTDDAGDRFGRSVAISSHGDILAVGAPWHLNKSGRIRVFRWDETLLSYNQLGEAIDGGGGEFMGQSVALSSDGKTLLVGATGNNENGKDAGQVRVFEVDF